MKKWLLLILCTAMLLSCASAEEEWLITLSDEEIYVNGALISENAGDAVYLAREIQAHPDVPDALKNVENRVVTITKAGNYRISGSASDARIAVRAGENDRIRLILDQMEITCRTAPGIAVYSAHDPRVPGEYGVAIELANGTENKISASHTAKIEDADVKLDGAVDSLVSLGFEGEGSLTVDADREGIEVKYGHMTINGGVFDIRAGDDPLNVSEDGVGTLTVNGGNLFSAVKPANGGEGDGIDSNGYIIFNGGTVINLAHPNSQDGGIDSDLGSFINGGVIVGAGNMYDPIESNSDQLFMMLEFNESTDDLVVVTDSEDKPVFAYDFPYDYQYIAFSAPFLSEGIYHVYLGGEIEGECVNGLYTRIDSYSPGVQMQHGGGTANRQDPFPGGGMRDMQPPEGERPFGEMQPPPDMPEGMKFPDRGMPFDKMQPGQRPEGFDNFGGMRPEDFEGFGGRGPGGFGGPRGMENSAEIATGDFLLTKENTGFTNIVAIQ